MSVWSQRVGVLAVLVINRVSILAILVSNGVWLLYSRLEFGMLLEQAAFSSLSMRPSTKTLHIAFNIGLNWGTNYKTGLKQGIDLRVRS